MTFFCSSQTNKENNEYFGSLRGSKKICLDECIWTPRNSSGSSLTPFTNLVFNSFSQFTVSYLTQAIIEKIWTLLNVFLKNVLVLAPQSSARIFSSSATARTPSAIYLTLHNKLKHLVFYFRICPNILICLKCSKFFVMMCIISICLFWFSTSYLGLYFGLCQTHDILSAYVGPHLEC